MRILHAFKKLQLGVDKKTLNKLLFWKSVFLWNLISSTIATAYYGLCDTYIKNDVLINGIICHMFHKATLLLTTPFSQWLKHLKIGFVRAIVKKNY